MYVTIVQSILPFAFWFMWMGSFFCHVIEITIISHATPSEYSEVTALAQLICYIHHVSVWNVHFQPFSNTEFGSL